MPKVPPQVLKNVVFLCEPTDLNNPLATAFLIEYPLDTWDPTLVEPQPLHTFKPYPAVTYLITCAHVFEDWNDENVAVRMNSTDGQLLTPVPEIPLDAWKCAPDASDREQDIAVARWDAPEEADLVAFPIVGAAHDARIEHAQIGPGTSAFYVGLFHRRPGEKRNIPVVRHGTIAALADRDEPVEFRDNGGWRNEVVHLVELSSTGGVSGSPVFARTEFRYVESDGEIKWEHHSPDEFFLLGVVAGHWGLDAETDTDAPTIKKDLEIFEIFNEGIAFVAPITALIEMLMTKEEYVTERAERKKERKRRRTGNAKRDLRDQSYTQQDYLTDLKKTTRRLDDQSDPEESGTGD